MLSRNHAFCCHRLCCLPHRRSLPQLSVGAPGETYSRANRPQRKRRKHQNGQNAKRQVNRPGFNSYLKVILDKSTIVRLHEYALLVQERIARLEDPEAAFQSSFSPVEETPLLSLSIPKQESQVQKRSLQKKRLLFKPRSKASLHMTLFFAGEALCKIPPTELKGWHDCVSKRLAGSGFLRTAYEKPKSVTTSSDHDFNFRVTGLAIFPPKRNNLVVAILEPCTSDWQALHHDIRDLSQADKTFQGLTDVSKNQNRNRWVSHVTLGNLVGGSKQLNKQLQPVLDEIFLSGSSDQFAFDSSAVSSNGIWQAVTHGISLGGPIPKQLDLDWNFTLL